MHAYIRYMCMNVCIYDCVYTHTYIPTLYSSDHDDCALYAMIACVHAGEGERLINCAPSTPRPACRLQTECSRIPCERYIAKSSQHWLLVEFHS